MRYCNGVNSMEPNRIAMPMCILNPCYFFRLTLKMS